MSAGLRHEMVLLLAWCFIALMLGAFIGHAHAALSIALLLYIVWNIYNLDRLTRWLEQPSKNVPESAGVWEEVYYQLYHLYQRQRKARKKLTSILARFQKSTQALPYATIVLNSDAEIEWFNPAASVMFKLRPGRDVGQRIDNLIRNPVFISYLNRKKYEQPLEFQCEQNKIALGITSYGSGQFLLSARDITLRHKLDDMRRDFIANASHELRTPLTVISGYIEALSENMDEKTNLPLNKIRQQAERMENILAELIELAKLESGDMLEQPVETDLRQLLQDVYNEAIELDRGEHVIELSVAEESIRGDAEELRVAFSNLLTNAIRYTPAGGKITIFAESDENGVDVGVRDEGIGIAYEHIPRLTERFYRVDAGRSREQGGTGLGLAIVKHVLDRHGATLHIQSTPGRGSVFRCNFPKQS